MVTLSLTCVVRRLQMTQESRGIGGAWAGGADGMTITNTVLQQLPVRRISCFPPRCSTADATFQNLLSPGGRLYLVAIHQNNTKDISARMLSFGLQSKVCCNLPKSKAHRFVQGNYQTTGWERTVICFENF